MYLNEAQERLDLFDKFFEAAMTSVAANASIDPDRVVMVVGVASRIARLMVIEHYEQKQKIFKDVKA